MLVGVIRSGPLRTNSTCRERVRIGAEPSGTKKVSARAGAAMNKLAIQARPIDGRALLTTLAVTLAPVEFGVQKLSALIVNPRIDG